MTNSAPNEGSSIDPVDWDALARYLAGESTPAGAAAMRDWIAAHPDRAELVATLDDAMAGATAVDTAPVDVEAALARVTARLDEPDVRPLEPRSGRPSAPKMAVAGRRVRTLALRAAAAVVLVAGGATLWRAYRDTGAAPTVARSYATTVGARDSVRLPDGTRVLLGPDTRLTVAAGYGEGSRAVALSGEAYFDVRHDARRPFTVRVGELTVTDVGTAFTVRAESGVVRIGVTEGAVSVSDPVATADSPLVLRRGDVVSLDGAGVPIEKRRTVTPDDTAWTQGKLVFRDAPLGLVRDDLRRWYGVELELSDPALASRHLTASFEGEPVSRVLDVIALALGARVEQRGDTAILRPATAGDGRRR